MTRRVAIIGTAAIPVGRHQTKAEEPLQVLEQEIMTKLVIEAVRDAGVEKKDIGSVEVLEALVDGGLDHRELRVEAERRRDARARLEAVARRADACDRIRRNA